MLLTAPWGRAVRISSSMVVASMTKHYVHDGPLHQPTMRQALFLTVLLLLTPLSGCFGTQETTSDNQEDSMYPSILERHTLEWNWTGSYARVLQDGPHSPLPVQEAFIDVDTTGTWEGGPNSAEVHLSYWLPSNTEAGEQVPVIAIVSPYFDYGSRGANQPRPTLLVAGAVNSSMTISFLMDMHSLRLQYSQPKKVQAVLTIEEMARALAFTQP